MDDALNGTRPQCETDDSSKNRVWRPTYPIEIGGHSRRRLPGFIYYRFIFVKNVSVGRCVVSAKFNLTSRTRKRGRT